MANESVGVLESSAAPQPTSQPAANEHPERLKRSQALPDKPLITIQPSTSWVALNVADLWAYRELFYFLTWRDVKVRYKQTALGVVWAILQPVMTMIVFTLIFGKLAGLPTDGIPKLVFYLSGTLPWTFFSNAVTNSSNSLVGSANLITKVYFPRMIIPSAAVGAGLIDFAIGFIVLSALMVYFGVALTWNILMLPVLVVLLTLLAVGVGMGMSALNVRYRDIRYALPFLIQIWFFASPIIYPSSFVPVNWRWLLAINPMTGIIDGFRSALFGRAFNWPALGVSVILTLSLLVYSAYAFRRMEKSFADIV
ncbi:MAG: ABC transporter permease [Armatimonadota bacterium]|nr:ABC transporter permease [Armatimonadota bacterium]